MARSGALGTAVLDIGGFSNDVFEVFDHKAYGDPAGDAWTVIGKQGKHLPTQAAPANSAFAA